MYCVKWTCRNGNQIKSSSPTLGENPPAPFGETLQRCHEQKDIAVNNLAYSDGILTLTAGLSNLLFGFKEKLRLVPEHTHDLYHERFYMKRIETTSCPICLCSYPDVLYKETFHPRFPQNSQQVSHINHSNLQQQLKTIIFTNQELTFLS